MIVDDTPLSKAQDILGMDPLPNDAEAQLDALYVKADEIEKSMFAMIYEGLFVLRNSS